LYKIAVKELEFETIIGILDFEREKPQRVLVECFIDYHDKKKFVNYADVVAHIKSIMIEEKFLLIEDALDSLIDSIYKSFPQIEFIKLTIEKPDIVKNCKVSVTKSKKF